jgi:uncharacterized protein (TIGR00255 family)
MQEEFSLAGEPDFNYIARLPNALQTKAEEVSDDFANGIETAVSLALDELETMRETEGESLKSDLNNLLSEIENHLPKIESEMGNVADEYQKRLTKRINDLLAKSDAQIELDQARLAQEVAYLADRSDISEEITRLKSHLEQYRGL